MKWAGPHTPLHFVSCEQVSLLPTPGSLRLLIPPREESRDTHGIFVPNNHDLPLACLHLRGALEKSPSPAARTTWEQLVEVCGEEFSTECELLGYLSYSGVHTDIQVGFDRVPFHCFLAPLESGVPRPPGLRGSVEAVKPNSPQRDL